MGHTAQTELLPAAQVARQTPVQQAENGICYATFGDHKLPPGELEQVIGAVPRDLAAALKQRAYYFVPLTIHEQDGDGIPEDAHSSGETLIAPQYTTELSDRAICHRNVHFAGADYIFISTRLMQDKFALAFELFINIGHHFVDTTGVPASFGELVDRQALAQVRGETSHDAWESRARAYGEPRVEVVERGGRGGRGDRMTAYEAAEQSSPRVDEKAKTTFIHAAFADALAIYMLSLTLDFDYADLREREYPLLAPPALADRLRAVAALFPPNAGYQFQVLYRRDSPSRR
ncbi:MAG: hypothetical protein QOK38_3860 [Acidobacteriaceae bacterium]|jgi:hypothetical protein|nr:hypothetical protein [Acidobacteriaceae bacterium]